MIQTSFYKNVGRFEDKGRLVVISIKAPIWARSLRRCEPLIPTPEMVWGKLSKDEFRTAYFEKLDGESPQEILEGLLNEPILLCWEDPAKGPKNWCHREMTAEWLAQRFGFEVAELPRRIAIPPTQLLLF